MVVITINDLRLIVMLFFLANQSASKPDVAVPRRKASGDFRHSTRHLSARGTHPCFTHVSHVWTDDGFGRRMKGTVREKPT